MRGLIAKGEVRPTARFLLRSLAAPVQTARWLDFLARFEALAAPALPPDLPAKPGRPYLCIGLSRAERTRLLVDHYGRTAVLLDPEAFRRLLEGSAIDVAQIAGRSGEGYRLTLGHDLRCAKEGELTVGLSAAGDGAFLAQLTFVVGRLKAGGPPTLVIGGLQGGVRNKARVVAATRDLAGLRPKALVLAAAYRISEMLADGRVTAVSNAGHVLRGAGAGGAPIRADYDAFWREVGGVAISNRLYRLPAQLPHRELSGVPAAKRKAWRARQALVCSAMAQLEAAIMPRRPRDLAA